MARSSSCRSSTATKRKAPSTSAPPQDDFDRDLFVMCDGGFLPTWRRLVVEPVTGVLLDFGAVVYRPPAALREFLVARDRRCRFPGCRRRAQACDVDHAIPHPHGPTAAGNCVCLCRRHHRMKTHGGWRLDLAPDGAATWTSPTGRVYIEHAHNQWETW